MEQAYFTRSSAPVAKIVSVTSWDLQSTLRATPSCISLDPCRVKTQRDVPGSGGALFFLVAGALAGFQPVDVR
jgi:hypothetical protein